MKDRIKKVMDESGLSASKFADKIGVPRSGLSHVLSGRNKPSLDYVLKVLNAFPELDPYWLIKGQKSNASIRQIMNVEEEAKEPENIHDLNSSIAQVNKKMEGQVDKMIRKISKDQVSDEIIQTDMPKNFASQKKVERIVYFFADGTFKEYIP